MLMYVRVLVGVERESLPLPNDPLLRGLGFAIGGGGVVGRGLPSLRAAR
jgi:hypothetical protein